MINRRDFGRLAGSALLGAGGLLPAAQAFAGESSNYVARRAPFFTAHVFPGSPLTLSERALRETGQNIIALTFDDGPAPGNDNEISRLLAENDAVASFFVIGSKAGLHIDVLKELINNGCEVGNHSWRHPMLTSLSLEAQQEELRQTSRVLTDAQIPVKWFRPPYGAYDQQVLQVAQAEGMETVLWSVDSRDWKGTPPDALAQRVIADLAPGAVILMHSTKTHTVQALPKILEAARRQNYRMVTLSEWKEVMTRVDPVAVRLVAESRNPHPEPHKVAEVPARAEPAKAVR